MHNQKLINIILAIVVAGSLFLPWFSISIYSVNGSEIEGLGILNSLCPAIIIILMVVDGLKNPISSNIQLAISLLSAGLIIYNVYVLKQFEFKSSILDTAKDVVDSIPFIDLNGLFEVKNEVGVYLFFSSLGVMQLVPFVNYFLKSKN
jgi:hypothetical protein